MKCVSCKKNKPILCLNEYCEECHKAPYNTIYQCYDGRLLKDKRFKVNKEK